ncbi:MAG: Ig-like domain-containing protein, partial [Planctomycetota bacterium]
MNKHQWLVELQEFLFPPRVEKLSKISRGRRRFGWSELLELRTLLAAPVSVNDRYNVTSGQTLDLPASGVLANDSDADGDPLTAQLVSSPMFGTLTFNANGSFRYTAPAGFMGNTSFAYRAYDGNAYSSQSTVTLNVSMGGGGGNQPPVARADALFVERNSLGARLRVLWNDTDPEATALSITQVGSPAFGSASVQTDPADFSKVIDFTPTAGYTGSDSFSYTISDGVDAASTTISLDIHAADNTLGTARALSLQNGVRLSTGGYIGDGTSAANDVDLFSLTMTAGQVVTIDVDAASIDGGGSYGRLNSLLRLFSSSGTQVAINDNGTDPDTNASSNDSCLTYTATTSGTYYIGVSSVGNADYNPTSGSGIANETIGSYQLKVLRETPNFAPSAINDNATTNRDAEIVIPVLANDSYANGDAITSSQVGVPAHGVAVIRNVSGVSHIAYRPDAGYSGTDSFSYTISDPSGATGTATVFVDVIANAPPTIQLKNPVTVVTESADTSAGIIVATIQVTDDGLGTNSLSLSGPGAAAFVISNNKLRIRSGYALDHETKPELSVTVTVSDESLGSSGVSSAGLTISVTDINEPPSISLSNQVRFLYDDAGTSVRTFVGDIVVTDDSGNSAAIGLTGADAGAFEILDNRLYLKAGEILNAAGKPSYVGTLTIDDPSLGSGPEGFVDFELTIRDANLDEGLPVFFVNSSADSLSFDLNDNVVTFREALERSRLAGPERSVIRFSDSVGSTIWLSAISPFPVSGNVRIEGPQDRRIRFEFAPSNISNIRMFNITSGANVTMQDVDLVGRRALRVGGGIHNSGRLTLIRSSVSENYNINGGGVFNSNAAELRVHYSTIFSNQATSSGGGIFAEAGSSVSVLNSTISGNVAQTGGGAWNAGAFQAVSMTLASNHGFTGAGLATTSVAPIRLSNSIVAANVGSDDLNGQFTSLGHNLIGNAGSVNSVFMSSDRVGRPGSIIDAGLSRLADFGGATLTHALLPRSPAIDAGGQVGFQSIDQRGAQRILDGPDLADPLDSVSQIDIGAFEFGTYFVNTTLDGPDVTPAGDGLVDTDNQTDEFEVSLRGAVQELNRLAGWNGSFDTQKVVMQGVIRFRPGMGRHWMTQMGAGEDQAGFGDLDIHGNLVIAGNGPQTHVDGGWGPTTPTGVDFRDRIFHVHPGSTLRLERMSIRGGHVIPDSTVVSDRGGAIYNDGGRLEIVDSVFGESPLSRGGSQAKQGGFLYTRNGHVEISDTAINAHRAEWGGAIFQESGNVVLNGSVLFANGSAFSGGGIYIVSGSLTVTDASQLNSNFAGGAGHGYGSPSNTGIADGGAIFVAPAALVTVNGESSLTGNLQVVGQNGRGLALYNQGKVEIDHGHVDDNGVWSALIPAIYNESDLTITDSTIDRNNSGAIVNRGGRLTLDRTSLSDNRANYWGIGITNDNGDVVIRDSRFVNNFTPMFAPTILNKDLDATLSITGSWFEGNTSEHAGGAVWNENGNVRIQTSTFLENNHWNDGGPGSGGAIHHTSRHVFLGSTPQRFLKLAASVNNSQSIILLEDVSAIQNLPLPLGIMIGSERMQVTEVNPFFDSIRVERNATTAESHRVSDRVATYISEQQEHLTLGDPGALHRYQLPLDVLVGLEVMTVTALQGNLATVVRGRRGTRPLPHNDPSDVWGVSGSLEISTTTFSSNRMQLMSPNDFDAGGAVSNIIRPFVTPTVIENSTFIANEAVVGTAIMTDMEEVRFVDEDATETAADERLRSLIVRRNKSWSAETYQLPTTSIILQNSVFSENQSSLSVDLGLPPVAGGYASEFTGVQSGPYTILSADSLVSGGGNFVDADAFRYTRLTSDISATATSFLVAQPSKEFPAGPFVMRISQPLDTHFVYEDILVTAWTLNEKEMRVALTVERGHNETSARAFSAGTKVRISDSGFWAPGDRIGTLDTAAGMIRTSLVAHPSGVSATATQLEVADTSNFPMVPFEIHVSHDVANPLPTGRDVYYEKMIVTAYSGNIVTVERGADWTEAIPHPHGARVEIDTTLFDRLDPGLLGLFGDEDEPRLPRPMPSGLLVDSGRTDRFGSVSADITTNLAGTWSVKTPVYMAVNENHSVALSTTLYADEVNATLDNVSSLPAVPFLLRLHDEVMAVTQVDTVTRRLTLQRAVARTERGQHDAGTFGVVGVSVTSTSDRMNVKDASAFPPAPFLLQLGREYLRVTAVDTSLNILTVLRGQSDSSAAAHSPGAIAAHGSLVQVNGGSTFPATPFPAWIGGELVRVRDVNVAHGIITLERGADRDQPELHIGPRSLVFSSNGLYAGFNGSKVVVDQQLSARDVDSDNDSKLEIDRGATEAIVFRVNTEQDLAEQSPGNGRIDTSSGLVSLRAAITESNAHFGESLILLPAGTFDIPEMPVSRRTTIRGMGHESTILRSSEGRVFRVLSTGHLELLNLTVSAGNVADFGGAILVVGGQLTTHYTVISGSTAARGGGIANAGGHIILWNSTLHGNTAESFGGAIWNSAAGIAELNNVTISGNIAQSGGGISSTVDSQLTLRNATVTLNQAIESAGGVLSLGKIQLGNSIIANNIASSDRDFGGFAVSLGGNLIGVIPTPATVIASPIDLHSSTLVVAETQVLPPTPFEVRVGGVETMTVVAVNGSEWTVERSSESSNRSTHPAGKSVRLDGIWKTQDQFGVSGNPLNPGLGSLSFDAGLVPVHKLLNGSPAVNAGIESVFTGVPLESTRRVKQTDRRIAVSQTDALPMVPFQIRANGETMTVVGIDNNVLETVRPQPFQHPVGTMFTVLADARGGLRSYMSIDRGAYEHLPILTISSTQSQVLETNAGTMVNFEFTIVRDGDTSQATDVEYIVLGSSDTSAEPEDFSSQKFVRQLVTFLPGENIKTISLPIQGDNIVETNEEFAVELWNETAGTIVPRRRIRTTILDNDSSVVTVTHAPSAEGRPAAFNVVLSNPVEDGVRISWSTSNGTAIAGQDYLAGQGEVSTNGSASAGFVVRTISDLVAERNETFQISVNGIAPSAVAGRVSFGTSSITGTILNDDYVTVRAVSVTRREGNSGQTAYTFDVVAGSTVLDVPYSITVTPVASSATATSDFVATPVTKSFVGLPGEVVSFTVSGVGDQSREPDEQFLLNLSASASGRENAFQFFNGTATILNDDSPRVFVSDVARIENNTGQLTAVFDVTLTNPMGQPVSVTVATQNGTAIAGQDFVSTSQTLTFTGIGTQTLPFSVPIIGDSALERDETFSVVLSNLQAGMMGASYYSLRNGTGTILNDDTASLSFVLPAGAAWVDSGDPRTSAVLLAPRGDLQLNLLLNGQIDSSFQATVTFVPEDDAQTDFSGLVRTKSFSGTHGELQRFPLRMSGWDFPGRVIAKVSLTGLDGRVVTLPNDLVIRVADQRNAEELRQLGLAEENDECGSGDNHVDVSGWRNEGTPGAVPIPVLIRMETYRGPDGSAHGRFVDPDGNVIPGPGVHNGIYYDTVTPDLSHAVEGDVGFGRDLWGFAVVPIEVDGIWYLIGSVDRQNYGTVAARTKDDTNGPKKHECEEDDDDEDDEEEAKPRPKLIAEADWTISTGEPLIMHPFETFSYRLADKSLVNEMLGTTALADVFQPDQLTIALSGSPDTIVPVETAKELSYGTVIVHADLSVTYTPYTRQDVQRINNERRSAGKASLPLMLPELDAAGQVVRYTGFDTFEVHLTHTSLTASGSTSFVSLASREITLAVSNHQAILKGDRSHTPDSTISVPMLLVADTGTASSPGAKKWTIEGLDGYVPPVSPAPVRSAINSNVFEFDGPLFAGLNTNYRIDLRSLFSDPDQHDLLKVKGLRGPEGYYSSTMKVKLGSIDTVNDSGFSVGTGISRFLTARLVGDSIIEITNPLTQSDLNPGLSRQWRHLTAASTISLQILFTDGQMIPGPDPEDPHDTTPLPPLPVYHTLNLQIRPHMTGSESTWKEQTAAAFQETRPWLTEMRFPESENLNVDPTTESVRNASVRMTAVARLGTVADSASKEVGPALVDLETGSFQLSHDLILDGSGGNSELALPGLLYDSSTIQPATGSGIVIQALVENSIGATSVKGTLEWYDHLNTDQGGKPRTISTTQDFTGSVPAGSQFLVSMRPSEAPIVSGLYHWKLTLEIKGAGNQVVKVSSGGQTPVVVNQDVQASDFLGQSPFKWNRQSVFGEGWDLAGVPSLILDYGMDRSPANSQIDTVDDRILLAFPGQRPFIFDAGPLTVNNFAFSGELHSLLRGSTVVGGKGFADPWQYGRLVVDNSRNEMKYSTGTGVDYVFLKHQLSPSVGQAPTTVYLLDRIEPVGVEASTDPAAFKRKAIRFERTDGRLTAIIATDGTKTRFDYAGTRVNFIRTLDANDAVIREVELSVDSDGRLVQIRHEQGTALGGVASPDRIRMFSYHAETPKESFVRSDRWYSSANTLPERQTDYGYSTPGVLSHVKLGDGIGSNGNVIQYSVYPAAQVALNAVSSLADLKASIELNAADLQTFNETNPAISVNSGGVFVTELELSLDGWSKSETSSFERNGTSTSYGTTFYKRDAIGNIKSVTTPTGRQSTYWYDYEDPIAYTTTDPGGVVYAPTNDNLPKYDPDDSRGNVTFIVSPSGLTVNEYETDDEMSNALGLLVKSRQQANLTPNHAVYDLRETVPSVSERKAARDAGHDEEYGGVLTTYNRRKEDGRVNTVWTVRGEPDHATDNLVYGTGGPKRPISDVLTGEDDFYEFWEYSNDGLLVAYTDTRGLTTTYEYDNKNRIQFITAKDEGVTSSDAGDDLTTTTKFAYDQLGFVETQVVYAGDANGSVMSQMFNVNDPSGSLLSTETQAAAINESGNVSLQKVSKAAFKYASDGIRTHSIDANDTLTLYTYNKAGQLLSEKKGLNSVPAATGQHDSKKYLAAYTGTLQDIAQTTT